MTRIPVWSFVVICVALSANLSRGDDSTVRAPVYADSLLFAQAETPKPGTTPDKGTAPAPAPAPRPPADQLSLGTPTTSRLDVSQSPFVSQIVMLGDPPPGLGIPGIAFGQRGNPQFPPVPGALKGGILVPSIRGFKISQEEAPAPQDRFYFGFNYWDNVNEAVNRRLGSGLHDLQAFRETFGVEKTFLDGDMSVGLRVPLDSLSASSDIPGLGGSSTDIGDVSVILKFALLRDRESGNVLSAGIAATFPTGPTTFGGFSNIVSFHETTLQPFIGYRYGFGDFFVHGFSSIDVPTDSRDVTILFNDIGIGYYLYRSREQDALLTAIVPTCEVHVNTPLNHRGALNFNDIAGTADSVDLTLGATFGLGQRSSLALAFVTPLSGPRPFDFEILAQFNYRFGASQPCNSSSTSCYWPDANGPRGK